MLGCHDPTHPKRYIDPEFGSQLVDQLLWGNSEVPVTVTKIADRQHCHGCGARVKGPTISSVRVSGRLVACGQPMQVEVSAPGVACSVCGLAQVFTSREVSSEISQAIIQAFAMAKLAP